MMGTSATMRRTTSFIYQSDAIEKTEKGAGLGLGEEASASGSLDRDVVAPVGSKLQDGSLDLLPILQTKSDAEQLVSPQFGPP